MENLDAIKNDTEDVMNTLEEYFLCRHDLTFETYQKGMSAIPKALALIQQQGRAIENMAEVNAGLSRKRDAMKNHIQQLEAQNAEKAERIKQLEAERDAAVADMAEIVGCPCGVCKHYLKDGRKEPCNSCRNIRRGEESHFEWRGVQQEEQ